MDFVQIAVEFIAEHEGFIGKAYPDPLHGWNVPTIGYGTTVYPHGKRVQRGDTCTKQEAMVWLSDFITRKTVPVLSKTIPVWNKLNSNQKAALISFGYNLGPGFYGTKGFTTISSALKDFASIYKVPDALMLYVNPGSRVENGLRKRRKAEGELFLKDYKQAVAPGNLTNNRNSVKDSFESSGDIKPLSEPLSTYKQLSSEVKWRFARMWRNNEDGSTVDISQVSKYYKQLPHQIEALNYLKSQGVDTDKLLLQTVIDLPVPYYSQRDNSTRPYQTCNMTCVAMILEYFFQQEKLKKDGLFARLRKKAIEEKKQIEDLLTADITKNYGNDAIYNHAVISRVLQEFGVRSIFNVKTPFSEIKEALRKGNPCIYSGKFTRSGHIVVIRGYDDTTKQWIVNDPFGEYTPNGYVSKGGNGIRYSYALLSRLSYAGSDTTWAHVPQ